MNQHPKWSAVVEIAKRLGAGEWAIRKWQQRNGVPSKWQIEIVKASEGMISFADFADMEGTSEAAE